MCAAWAQWLYALELWVKFLGRFPIVQCSGISPVSVSNLKPAWYVCMCRVQQFHRLGSALSVRAGFAGRVIWEHQATFSWRLPSPMALPISKTIPLWITVAVKQSPTIHKAKPDSKWPPKTALGLFWSCCLLSLGCSDLFMSRKQRIC